ncbi:MAG: hypothetical protein JWO78_1129 [Micavibrio sp.]|nr:hypothetical protein [Micavibrio sp.]
MSPKLQRKYIKIDGSYSTEPPHKPEDDVSLVDKFASMASAPFRKATCANLRQAFNNLYKSDKVANEHGTPHTVQILQGLKYIENEVGRLTSTIEAGGIAGVKAWREARDFLTQDLESKVLQPT